MKRVLIVACAALTLTACTSLQTQYESQSSGKDFGLKGMPYSLPATDYAIVVDWMLSDCPNIDLDYGGGKTASIAVQRRLLSAKAAATPRVTAGERFIVDYEKLQSWVKTTSFSIETHPNGVLKSINATADDQSDEILQAVVTTAITLLPLVAPAATPLAPAATPLAPAAAVPNRLPASLSQDIEVSPASSQTPRPIRPLAVGPAQSIVVCTQAARKTLQAYRQSLEAEKDLSEELEAKRQAVEDLRVVVAQRTVLPEHLTGLESALKELRMAENALKEKKGASADLASKLSVQTKFSWPSCARAAGAPPPSNDCKVSLKDTDVERLSALFTVADVPLVSHQQLKDWADKLTDDEMKRFEKLNPRVISQFFDEFGRLEPEPELLAGCAGTSPSVAGCIKDTGALSVTFKATTSYPRPTDADLKERGCKPPTANTTPHGSSKNCPVSATKSQAGIFYRTPAEGTLGVKTSADAQSVLSTPVTVPQLGQLRFLPFRSRMFETGAIGLVLRPDGTLERFTVGQSEAAGLKAAKAADGVATSYADYVEEQRNRSFAALQREIDVKTKQLELLRLDATLSTQAITAETNSLLAEIALLKAELDRLKAERALATERGGS